MTRRITKLAAVYLLLGLVATWAVALACGALMDVVNAPQVHGKRIADRAETGRGQTMLVLSRHAATGLTFYRSRRYTPGAVDGQPGIPPEELATGWAEDTVIPRFRASIPEHGKYNPQSWIEIEAAGWPFRAFWYEYKPVLQAFFLSRIDVEGAIVVRERLVQRPGTTSDYPLVIPTRPLLAGLIADTLLYALLLASLHQLVGWGRRARRRRRGRCAGCGYDLSGLEGGACPECGTSNPAQASSA